MNPFAPLPPEWTATARHAQPCYCPNCQADCITAVEVWLNRRSPVYTETHQRKWQEFYLCSCGQAWWFWSSDRPPSNLLPQEP